MNTHDHQKLFSPARNRPFAIPAARGYSRRSDARVLYPASFQGTETDSKAALA
jgi:hypothetical protein